MTQRILRWACLIFLGAIFIYTGYIKLKEPLQFAVAITGYQLVPENLIFPVAKYFPWLEIALGVFLLTGWKSRYAGAAAALLLLFFTVILTITYMRGIEANCGCFSFNDRITPKTILRDSLILLPALFLVFERKRPRKSEDNETASVNIEPGVEQTNSASES